MEENKNVSKNGWKRLFKKKWFFPAVYLGVAALLLSVVLWYQNIANQGADLAEDLSNQLNNGSESENQGTDDAAPVMQQQEVLQLPVAEDLQVDIVTKFYDYSADEAAQEKALILYQNKYKQSDGIAITTADQQAFDVMASLSGTVAEIKQDPLWGMMVKMVHDEGIATYYASLGEVLVEEGTELKQGQVLGTAGQSNLGAENGIHVQFEVRKDDEPINPETFLNKPINTIKAPSKSEPEDVDVDEDAEDTTDEQDAEESNETDTDTESDKETDTEDDAEKETTDEHTHSSAESTKNA